MIKSEFLRIIKAFSYSFDGLRSAFRTEPAFRWEVLAFVIAFPVSFMFNVTAVERAVMIASLFLVLIVELLNSSIEATIDRISEERHVLSKKAKDQGSAAVLLAILSAFSVWAIILFL